MSFNEFFIAEPALARQRNTIAKEFGNLPSQEILVVT